MYWFEEYLPDENCFTSVWNEWKLCLSITFPPLMTSTETFPEACTLWPEFVDLTEDVTLLLPPVNPVVQEGRIPQELLSKSRKPLSCLSEQITEPLARSLHTFSSMDALSPKLHDRINPIMTRRSFIQFFWAKLQKSPDLNHFHVVFLRLVHFSSQLRRLDGWMIA